jgi:VanZ family protein
MRLLLHWGPVVLLMALLYGASSVPDVGSLPGGVSDKIAHFSAYALLAILVLRALAAGRFDGVTWRRSLIAVLITILFGASDEWHQSYVPGREAEALDIIADAIGGAAGAAFVLAARGVRGVRRTGGEI